MQFEAKMTMCHTDTSIFSLICDYSVYLFNIQWGSGFRPLRAMQSNR